ncbi:MAG: Serine-type D-Ala-D-Ala carboxypeptidase [Clostridia bacterium]|jgi:D-alanyl-D-alanine carboxypeptidase|nr:Serine-type D-Ala-D-Ala carboxypeptidase [Clostridia bacterium]
MYKKYVSFFVALTFICFSIAAKPLPPISAEGAILIEPKTNTVLYSKNANEKFYPASTTKVLTSLILLEDMPLGTTITKTKNSILNVPSDSSQIGIKVGEKYSSLEGLYAVLLASDNFVSYDMAVKNAGSQKAFANKMNEKANSLGALSSHFVNAHGYHHPDHFTTPFDLSQIARAAFNNTMFSKIAGTKEHVFKTQDTSHEIPLKHTALLLDPESRFYNPNVVGAKTGFHTPAKRTLVAKAKYDNIELIGIVMKTDNPHQFEDMNALFEYGTQNYSLVADQNGINSIVNHSYSQWAKPYVDFALEKEWITNTTKNYTDSITRREFVNLLKASLPDELKSLSDEYIDYDGDSIFKENLPTSRKEVALICYNLLNKLSKAPKNIPLTPNIPDISNVSEAYKDAIYFVVSTGILGQNDTAFNPEGLITYEQALSILYRLSPIINLYHSYSLNRFSPSQL